MHRILQIVAQTGPSLVLIGVAAVVLVTLLNRILALDIFARMSGKQTYRVIKLIIGRLFALAVVLIVLGFHASLLPAFVPPSARLAPDAGSPATEGAETSERTTQVFTRQVGNGASCAEADVSTSFDLCLDPRYAVTDWEEIPLPGRNDSASVDRHDSMPNCVRLTFRYSDYGHDARGACLGHGYSQMKVRLHGRPLADTELNSSRGVTLNRSAP